MNVPRNGSHLPLVPSETPSRDNAEWEPGIDRTFLRNLSKIHHLLIGHKTYLNMPYCFALQGRFSFNWGRFCFQAAPRCCSRWQQGNTKPPKMHGELLLGFIPRTRPPVQDRQPGLGCRARFVPGSSPPRKSNRLGQLLYTTPLSQLYRSSGWYNKERAYPGVASNSYRHILAGRFSRCLPRSGHSGGRWLPSTSLP